MKKCLSLPDDVTVVPHLSAFVTRKLRELPPWQEIDGWLTEAEGICLQRYGKDKRCLEIGAYKGRSSVALAQVAREVISVDPFSANDAGIAQENRKTTLIEYLFHISGYQNIFPVIGYSHQILPLLKTRVIDMVFVDGKIRLLYRDWETDRKSTHLNSSHSGESRMPSSA